MPDPGNTKGWTFDTFEEYFKKLREDDQAALAAAFEAAKEKSASHNDLIRAMERQQSTFVTKGMIYSAIITLIMALGLVVAWYANFGGPQ